MDRIAKAIELARQAGNEPAGVEPLRLREPARAPAAAEVRYSTTRRIAVSADLLRARHITVGDERTPMAEAFKRLRTQILQRLRESGRSVLGIASARPGEGKTTVALNLAVHAAMEHDWTVLLVDADVRRPGLCDALGIAPLPGLAEYLMDGTPLESLLVHPGFGRCVLLPAGGPVADSSEILGSARMHDLVLELKARYADRLVIVDLPPLLDAADGLAALPWVEAIVLVVAEGATSPEDAVRAAEMAGSERLLGTVLNKSSAPAATRARGWWRRLVGG